jgi:hypothetical protein
MIVNDRCQIINLCILMIVDMVLRSKFLILTALHYNSSTIQWCISFLHILFRIRLPQILKLIPTQHLPRFLVLNCLQTVHIRRIQFICRYNILLIVNWHLLNRISLGFNEISPLRLRLYRHIRHLH